MWAQTLGVIVMLPAAPAAARAQRRLQAGSVCISVGISDTPCFNCSALTTMRVAALQANAYGRSMSVVHVGVYAWSYTYAKSSNSSSTCEATSASRVSVNVSDAPCSNCIALTTSSFFPDQANASGCKRRVDECGARGRKRLELQ
jgi:hypothetical protein